MQMYCSWSVLQFWFWPPWLKTFPEIFRLRNMQKTCKIYKGVIRKIPIFATNGFCVGIKFKSVARSLYYNFGFDHYVENCSWNFLASGSMLINRSSCTLSYSRSGKFWKYFFLSQKRVFRGNFIRETRFWQYFCEKIEKKYF